MINLYATDSLTLVERSELERFVTGPITEQHVQDKLRARGATYVAVESEDQVRARRDLHYRSACEHSAMLTFWRSKQNEGINVTTAIDHHSTMFRKEMDATDEMDRKLDAMTAPHQVAAE